LAPDVWHAAQSSFAWPPSIDSLCSVMGCSAGFHFSDVWHATHALPSAPLCGSLWQLAQLSPSLSMGLSWQVLHCTFLCAPTSGMPVSAWSNDARAGALV